VWIFKQYQLTIYQLITDKYEVSETSRYFPGVLLQQTIDDCFVIAKERGTGAAISELRRFLNNWGKDILDSNNYTHILHQDKEL